MLDDITEKINSILPQTQCGKCDFSGCKPYAKAIAEGKADINQCPPGGKTGILKIAQLLNVEYKPLNERHGVIKPREIAIIEENECIGCTLCILACPVDAILGASKSMHTVISDECTGCELCIEPCPVDCIKMEPLNVEDSESIENKRASLARSRYEFKQQRILRERNNTKANRVTTAEKKQAIANAMARLKKK
ncbi:electron transport complex subunit RsxB [Methylophilaceae bacterium]|jgi:electron transport complex protein RnfB|nr:electron transport complex subunit RsxB [Methylophilaceae bacterium]|tara:strand:+ start:574 stop:1155 length:582 start_codon:yes stop_codon:yes gene_type:complete